MTKILMGLFLVSLLAEAAPPAKSLPQQTTPPPPSQPHHSAPYPGYAPRNRAPRRTVANVSKVNLYSADEPWRWGFLIGGDGLLGRVSYGDASKGLGYSAGLQFLWRLDPDWRITGSFTYQYMRLGRSINASGDATAGTGLTDDAGAVVEQAQRGVGAEFLGQYLLEGASQGHWDISDPNWWLDFGLGYLHPLNAVQSDSVGTELTYTGHKYGFVVLGASGEVPVGGDWALVGTLRVYSNVLGGQALKLLGVRLGLALHTSL